MPRPRGQFVPRVWIVLHDYDLSESEIEERVLQRVAHVEGLSDEIWFSRYRLRDGPPIVVASVSKAERKSVRC